MRLIIACAFVLLTGGAMAQAPLTGTTGQVGSPRASVGRVPPATAPAVTAPAVTAPPASSAATPPPAHRRGYTLQERFEMANTTHDGHLTQEQARAKMPSVARDFADIDTSHRGFVTVDEIREHRRAVRAAHRAAKKAAAAKPS